MNSELIADKINKILSTPEETAVKIDIIAGEVKDNANPKGNQALVNAGLRKFLQALKNKNVT